VQSLRCEGAEATLLVCSTIHHAPHLRPTQCSGAHYARLYGDVERAVGKILATELVGSRRYRLHLGVRRNVAERLREVVRSRNDAVARHDDGAHGYLSLVARSLRLHKSAAHKLLVFILLFGFAHIHTLLYIDTKILRKRETTKHARLFLSLCTNNQTLQNVVRLHHTSTS